MKRIFTLMILLTLCLNTKAQCVKLYIVEKLYGDPICYLSSGDYIEICEDANEVNGCPRNLYIYNKSSRSGSLTYELSQDPGWAVNYGTLIVNTNNQRFGFIINGVSAMYSYKTEMDIQREEEIKNIKIKQENERKLILDKSHYSLLDELVSKKNFEAAIEESNKLFFPDSYPKINTIKNESNRIQEEKRKEAARIITEKQNIDKATAKSIRIDLQSSNTESVINNWKLLNFPENYSSLKDSVINFVASKENNTPVIATQEQLKSFIERNKNALLQLGNTYSGNQKTTISFDNQNRASINGFVWNAGVFKDYGSGIITYQKINFILDFSVSTTDNEKKEPVIYSSSKASIAQKINGFDFYEVNFLTWNYLLENNVVTTTYDASIKDKYLKIIWPMLKTVNVNGITLGTTETSITTEEKLNPRIVRKTIRLIGITSTLGAAGYLYYVLYM